MDHWKIGFNTVNATNTLAKAGTQKPDERYYRVQRIPPPPDPTYTPAQQYPPQLGENASYYAPQPASPFSPAIQAPIPQYETFVPPPAWNQTYANPQQQTSSPPPAQPYLPEGVNSQPQSQPQPQYHLNQYPTSPLPSSPSGGYEQPYPYSSPVPQSQAPTSPPQRSQTEYTYNSSPAPVERSYTMPVYTSVEPHNCYDHWEP